MVILDVGETVLDNSKYQAWMVMGDNSGDYVGAPYFVPKILSPASPRPGRI